MDASSSVFERVCLLSYVAAAAAAAAICMLVVQVFLDHSSSHDSNICDCVQCAPDHAAHASVTAHEVALCRRLWCLQQQQAQQCSQA
jgi:hypothetical protein